MSKAATKVRNPTSSYRNIVIIRGALAARGIDAGQVLREAGIEPDVYENTEKRVPFEAVDRLFRLVVERTGDPTIGIDVVDHMNPTVYEALGVAMLCSSTLRNFFRRFERFFDIVSSLERGVFHETEYGGYFAEEPFVRYSDVTRGVHADAFLAVVIKFMRLVYQPDYVPRKVELNWTPPELYHDKYQKHFGPNVEFGASKTAIHVASEDLDAPLSGSNASLAFHNDQLATAILADLKKQDLRARVYARLIEYLPAGDCSREKVAHSLNMSESAFQKKLKVEGTSYQEVLDNTRSELARHYLEKSGLSISEAAFLLGFTDSSNFSRAFKRWTGKSPTDFREASQT
ncbi:MAG: AraC family transcriptional regulator ligand-binding domain-containing protein [Woeseiaceae bacterium]